MTFYSTKFLNLKTIKYLGIWPRRKSRNFAPKCCSQT